MPPGGARATRVTSRLQHPHAQSRESTDPASYGVSRGLARVKKHRPRGWQQQSGVDGPGAPVRMPLGIAACPLIPPCLSARSAVISPTARCAFPSGAGVVATGLKHRSALRSFIEGVHCVYYNFKSNLKQRQEMERSTPYACHDWWHVDHDGRAQGVGAWRCVEDGGGVWGESSQACFHAASIEMDNLTLTRRSSTYKACAHVPPMCGWWCMVEDGDVWRMVVVCVGNHDTHGFMLQVSRWTT